MAIVILQILMDLKGKDPVEVAEAISELRNQKKLTEAQATEMINQLIESI